MEELIKILINSDLKLISKETGIPYDRMYKWTKGKAKPKIEDYNILSAYFNGRTSNPASADGFKHPEFEYGKAIPKSLNNIPMYNFPIATPNVEWYSDPSEVKIVGYLNIPGSVKDSFALPVYGHAMHPTLENGSWCVLREMENKSDISWGEIYYIEYGDYRQFKRLLKAEDDGCVTLWSDNQSDVINNKPQYSPKTIRLEQIKKLCLLTDILKKPNY